ncbi:ribosomal protein S18 acetylase RimI-like enzyme [Phyllobacterium brassicacearum]|nr:ribosomal protein S18 acetylase RimI-like enzyme [Phyllobacterium brassicacearum]
MLIIRPARSDDADAIWNVIGPVLRAGETYALPRDWSRSEALSYWFSKDHEVFVAEDEGLVTGTYFIHANHRGGGAHVANCGYMTAPDSVGKGVATAMCQHSMAFAATRGFRAMQFNCVVSSNERAVRLWSRLGFNVVGTIPQAFEHPDLGFVDALIMHRAL